MLSEAELAGEGRRAEDVEILGCRAMEIIAARPPSCVCDQSCL